MEQKPRAHSQDPLAPPATLTLPDLTPPAPLPAPLASLVGRERDVDALRETLARETVRLVTLTGAGGVGKSRLALAAGAAVTQAFPDGVRLVRLAAITDPGLVVPTIAATLGLRDAGTQSPLAALQAALHDRQMLLILDNFEQILAAGPDIADLLRACPRLKALVTSRALLRVRGEHVIPVLPLTVPDEAAVLDEELSRTYPAVELFLRRGREVRPELGQSLGDMGAVAGICRRLDGLPLALELAAARLDILPPAALLERLRLTLPLLTGGARDLPDRLRTMRDAIAWSYNLLDEHEQTLFRRLSVFTGGFTLEAAEWVAGAGLQVTEAAHDVLGMNPQPATRYPLPTTLDLVASLAEKSLLRLEESADGEPRYLMMETVREFGREQLAASGDEPAARSRHAAWCLTLAERAEPKLLGSEQRQWCERLEAEHANLRAAHAWFVETAAAAPALRLASALWVFWFLRGHLREGYAWLVQALAIEGDAPPDERVKALWAAGMLAWSSGQFGRAEELGLQARSLAEGHGLTFGEATALYLLFLATDAQGRNDEAIALGEESVARMRASGARAWLAYVLADVGTNLLMTGDRRRGEAWIEEGFALHREFGNKQGIGNKLNDLGLVSHESGDTRTAARQYAESLRWLLEGGDAWYLASPIEGLAAIALEAGQAKQAARLLGAAAALRECSGGAVWTTERDRLERTVATARSALGDEDYAQELAVGRSMPMPEVVATATAIAETFPAAAAPTHLPSPAEAAGLSPRELDVLKLLAVGKSNPEIADALFIGRGTVRTHVSNILAKLDAKTRTEASMLARDRGLV